MAPSPNYLTKDHGQPDLTILCQDGVVAAHRVILGRALSSFHAAFFPNGSKVLAGPTEIGFNGGVEAAHLFLADMYGEDIKVNRMVDCDVLLDIESIALQFSATFLFSKIASRRSTLRSIRGNCKHYEKEGRCEKGSSCLFAHTNASRTYKTVVCPIPGHKDPECNYSHGGGEQRRMAADPSSAFLFRTRMCDC